MKRREFITLLGGAVAAFPLAAVAQQTGKIPRIGFFGPSLSSAPQIAYYKAFIGQLRENGFREGQNFSVELKAVDDPRGAMVSAAELLRTQPDLIIASGPEVALQAVMGASGYVPIVMLAVNFDPFERGYVSSLARPGGNITGVVARPLELAAKQLQLLTQVFPDRSRLAVFYDAQTAGQFIAAERMAKSLNLQVQAVQLEIPKYDFEAAFRSAMAGGAQMVAIMSSPAFTQHRERLANLAIEHRLPTMFTSNIMLKAVG